MNNWPIYGDDGVAITAAAASAATLVAPGYAGREAEDVMIDNPGPNDVFVKAGGADAVATLNSVRVPAYSLQPFRKGPHTHLAFRTASGSQAVVVHLGAGA